MSPLPLGATLGILGGGQLGRMTADAAHRLGYRTHVLTPEPDSPAGQVATRTTHLHSWTDQSALLAFAGNVDAITLEFENVPVDAVAFMAQHVAVHPGALVLAVCQHRLREKETARRLGLGTVRFARVAGPDDYASALAETGLPAILKTTTDGYDGKGQRRVESAEALVEAHAALGHRECVLEGFVRFAGEVSVVTARTLDGKKASFPVTWNEHRDHILHMSVVPAPVSEACAERARLAAESLADALGVVGLLAVEFFVTDDDQVLVNEMAPRPHNSGHWTQDGCATSQFEQLVRAVCGLPLGPTTLRCPTRMVNLIGDDVFARDQWLAQGAHVHLYGKSEARPGRKMGHVNVTDGLDHPL